MVAKANAVTTDLSITGSTGAIFIWGEIDDSQTPNYSEIDDSQTPSYSEIATSQSPNYTSIKGGRDAA